MFLLHGTIVSDLWKGADGKHIVEIVESLGTDEKLMMNSFAIGVLRMQELYNVKEQEKAAAAGQPVV